MSCTITDNLAAHFPFDDAGGVTWEDATGRGNDLTNEGAGRDFGPCSDSYSVFCNSGEYDGGSCASTSDLSPAGDCEFTLFFKGDGTHASTGPIFCKGLVFPATLDYSLFYDPVSRTLEWTVRDSDGNSASVVWDQVLTNDVWYFVSVIHRNGIGIAISVDGAPYQWATHRTGIRQTAGYFHFGNANVGSYHFGGWISNLSIYNGRILSSQERNYLGGIYPKLHCDPCPPLYPFSDFDDYGWRVRALSTDLAAHLQLSRLTLAVCVEITRQDGEVLGFTSHDRDLTLCGVTYEALSSVQASALRQELGAGIDNLEAIGLLQSDAISEADLRAGLYDGATVRLLVCNWADLTQGSVTLLAGTMGNITLTDGQYQAELRSQMQRFAQQIGELTAPVCTAALGDSRCKVDLASFQVSRTIAAVTDRRNFTFASESAASGTFSHGMVEFTSGANAGLKREIKTHTLSSGQAVLVLQEAFPYDVQIGDTAKLTKGCDFLFATCRDRFSNAVNFRGFPVIPGTDKVLARGRPPSG